MGTFLPRREGWRGDLQRLLTTFESVTEALAYPAGVPVADPSKGRPGEEAPALRRVTGSDSVASRHAPGLSGGGLWPAPAVSSRVASRVTAEAPGHRWD